MSDHIPPKNHAGFLSRIDNVSEEPKYEDTFTAGRPPQYNDSNQSLGRDVPSGPNAVHKAVVSGPMLSLGQGGSDHYPASCQTESTATVLLADKAAAEVAAEANAPLTRPYIHYHVDRDYDGAAGQLTEHAVAALNNDYWGSYTGDVSEWVLGRSRFPPSDPVDLSLSVLCNPRTRTYSTLESSGTMVSSSTSSGLRVEHVAEAICAAGLQFADVAASPTGHTLLEEDLMPTLLEEDPMRTEDLMLYTRHTYTR